jgi:hypothetical protein
MIRTALSLAALVIFLSACSPEPPSSPRAAKAESSPHSAAPMVVQLSGRPELTVENILKDVVGKHVSVNDAAGEMRPLDWTFEADEPKHAEILERQVVGTSIALVIQMNTGSAPDADEENVQLSGKLRLHYEWSGRNWSLRSIENLTFRFSRGIRT